MSAIQIKKQIVRLSKKAKASFITKEVFVFLLFFILSTLLWFLYKTSQLQEVRLNVPIIYQGIPSDVKIDETLPSHLIATFKDKGSSLFFYMLRRTLPPITIDLSNHFATKGEKFFLLTRYYEKEVSSHLRSSVESLFLSPDTLFVSYNKLYVKRLPVRFSGNIQFARQFMLSDSIQLIPDVVAVFGSKAALDTMNAVYTEPLMLNDVKDSLNVKCRLHIPSSLRVVPSVVMLHALVEPFTEKSIEVPVEAINMPQNLILRTFPAFVKVICLVGISHFNELNADDLRVVVDYNMLPGKRTHKANVTLLAPVSVLNHSRVTPESVDYLLESKH
jgi:hypothetical protein